MKNRALASLIILALVACEKQSELNTMLVSPFKIYLSDVVTKTSNDGLSTKWVEGDQLLVQYSEAGSEDLITPGNGRFDITNVETGEATPKTAPTLDEGKEYDWYAFYKWSYKGNVKELKAKTIARATETSDYIQEGNNSMKHISGTSFPIYGVAKNVPGNKFPQIRMKHIATVLEVAVKNGSNKEFTVNSVTVQAPGKALVGNFTINCFSEPISITPSTSYSDVTLTVSDGSSIPINGSASFYVGTAPFVLNSEEPLLIKVSVSNGDSVGEQTLVYEAPSEIVFGSGKIRKLEMTFSQIF